MNKKIIKLLVYLIVISFLCSYLIDKTGYYEYSLNNKKNLTEESIKRFEEDVKKGKDIDINNYLENTYVDYSNKLTDTTSRISIKLNNYLKEFLTNGLNIFEKLIK